MPALSAKELLRGLHERVEEVRGLPPSEKRALLLLAVTAALVVGTLISLHGIARHSSGVEASYSRLERSLLTTLVRETAP